MPGLGHAGDRAVEAGPGAGQDGGELVRSQLERALAGAHAADRVDGQVEEGAVQDQQELPGDAGLAWAGGPVEEDDLPGPGCCRAHGVIILAGPEEVLAVAAAEEEGEAVQVGAEGVRAVGGVADEGEQ